MEIGALNILEVVWSSSLKRNCSVVYGTRGKDSCLSSIRMFTGNPLVIPPKDVCMGIFVSISCLIKLLTTSSLTEKKEDIFLHASSNVIGILKNDNNIAYAGCIIERQFKFTAICSGARTCYPWDIIKLRLTS